MLRTPPRSLLRLALAAFVATLAFGAAPADAAPTAYRGVQLHSLWSETSDAEMQRELNLSRDAGSTTVRVDVGWSSLETEGKGQYSDWYVDKLDSFMNGAHARGMKVIATVWSTPCWASTAPESKKQECRGAWWDREVTMYPPKDNSDFGDISGWITARYGTKLAAVEVWNEPNLPEDRFWIAPDEPRAYAGLVKAAYPAVKAANRDVKVLAGSLAAADRPFLEALYANGIKGSYDAISIHPYNEDRAPSDRWQSQWKKYTFLPGVEWIHEAQQAAGDNTPLWLTEFGWTSCSGAGWCVSERQQAGYIRAAFRILRSTDYVQGAIVYNLRSQGTDAAAFEDNFGLVRENFAPKPAYAALRDGLTGSGTATRRPSKRARRVAVRVHRKGDSKIATGRAPRGSRVLLRISGCRHARAARAVRVRASRSGRFNKRLGTIAGLAGCRVAGVASRR